MAVVALTSLMSTLELEFLQSTPRARVYLDEEDESDDELMCCLVKRRKRKQSVVCVYGEVEMLHKKLCCLQSFLQKLNGGGPEIKDLEIKIRDFALKTEDHIEIQVSNFLLAKDGEKAASQELHQSLREAAQNAAQLLKIISRENNSYLSDKEMGFVALSCLISTIDVEFLRPIPRVRVSHSHLNRAPNQYFINNLPVCEGIKSLLVDLSSLQAFLRKESSTGKGLEIQITDFALKAEDRIQIQLTNFPLVKHTRQWKKASNNLLRTLQDAITNAAKLLNIINITSSNELELENVKFTGSSPKLELDLEDRMGMVGRRHDRRVINNFLFDYEYDELRVISIVGMMGIGKTTLARSIYNDPSVASHFEVRSWITLPQEYQHVNQIVQDLFPSISQSSLAGRRYLIVLDNLWDNSAWQHIQSFLPKYDRTGSRIIITTMHFDQKCYAGTSCYKHNMTFLDPKESWDLFCNILSPNKSMAPKFEKIRSEILEKCEGLPQLIVDVAKRLSNCNNVQQERKKTEKELELLGTLDRTVLTLRHNQLPRYLNVCFLYFGVFPKRSEIPVKMLIRLWIAEGFVKSLARKELESVAYEYLQELVERSLVLISTKSLDGKIKTCRMHGSMHTFCVGEAQKGGILCAVNVLQFPGVSLNAFANSCRWLSFYRHSFDYYVLFDTINSRSIFFFHDENPEICVPPKLLRVLASVPPPFFQRMQMHFGDFIFLRYISVAQWFEGLDDIVSINGNLQTLVVSGNESQAGALSTVHLPSKIWESPQLRHLELGNSFTVDPPSVDKKNLQTLSWVSPTYCRKEVYIKFPKLKELKIFIKDELELNCTCGHCSNPIILDSLDYLKGLEELTISVSIDCTVTLQNWSMFPFLLEKLRLSGLNLSERHLTLIGKLPQLKVLKLENAFHGKVWEVSEGGFRQLGILLLEAKNLVQLKANKYSFPYLQHLHLRFCYCLEEIPRSFADIFRLQSIELKQCSSSVVAAAKQIREGLHPMRRRMFEIKIDGSEYEESQYPQVEDDLAEITLS